MRGFNHVVLVGNLARDPEVRHTNSGKSVATFSLAVNNKVKNKDGGWDDAVDFIPVKVWNKDAENCEKYLQKGSPILVEGRISVYSYEGKDGTKKRVTEVVAKNINFIGSQGNSNNSKPTQASTPKSFREETMDVTDPEEDEEDLPF